MSRAIQFWAVVPAAGVGKRMQADRPKQYLRMNQACVIEHTLARLLSAEVFSAVSVAISQEDPYWPELEISKHPDIIRAEGGKERADSVLSAMHAISEQAAADDWVLVHDAARPCLTVTDIQHLIKEVTADGIGGILALPSHDTLKQVSHGAISSTIDRSSIWRALTPQMFRFGDLKHALEQAAADGSIVTDEASALELQGMQPKIVAGRTDNIKITRPEDLALAEFYLERQCLE